LQKATSIAVSCISQYSILPKGWERERNWCKRGSMYIKIKIIKHSSEYTRMWSQDGGIEENITRKVRQIKKQNFPHCKAV
jgi:hypothetical protein